MNKFYINCTNLLSISLQDLLGSFEKSSKGSRKNVVDSYKSFDKTNIKYLPKSYQFLISEGKFDFSSALNIEIRKVYACFVDEHGILRIIKLCRPTDSSFLKIIRYGLDMRLCELVLNDTRDLFLVFSPFSACSIYLDKEDYKPLAEVCISYSFSNKSFLKFMEPDLLVVNSKGGK